MTKVLYCLILALLLVRPCSAQQLDSVSDDIEIIMSFVEDIANPDFRADIILSKHVVIDQTNTDEGYDYLEASIEEIRLNLETKNIQELDCIPFHQLSKRQTRDIDPEGKPTDRMYFLYYKNKQALAIYLENNKIASFTLVSKGNNMAHFVTY